MQGPLKAATWAGIVRALITDAAGAWSYEVFDTKLAKEPRGRTILQTLERELGSNPIHSNNEGSSLAGVFTRVEMATWS
jgi:hypothetical protein